MRRVLDNEAIDIEARHTQACVVVSEKAKFSGKLYSILLDVLRGLAREHERMLVSHETAKPV